MSTMIINYIESYNRTMKSWTIVVFMVLVV